MARSIYGQIDPTTEGTYALSFLSKGAYSWTTPTDLAGILALRDIVLLSFVDASDTSPTDNQGDWLGKMDLSATPAAPFPSLKAIYRDLDPAYGELPGILVAAVLYHPTLTWNAIQYGNYLTTSRGYSGYSTPGGTYFLPEAIFYMGAYSGSLAQYLAGGWAGCSPAIPVGPFSYLFCRKGTTAERYVADKLHRASAYDGEEGHSPLTDLAALGWTGGPPASFSELRSFLSARLGEHASTATVSFRPRAADNLSAGGGPPHFNKSVASLIAAEFSEKTIGLGAASKYLFSPAVSGGLVASTPLWAARSAAGVWGRGTSETQALSLDSSGITAGTVAISVDASLLEASQLSFAGSESYVFDTGSDIPSLEASISDGTTSYPLGPAADPPAPAWSSLALSVAVKTAYPARSQPTGRLVGPSGFATVELAFSDHAVSGLVVSGLVPGLYTLVVDRYVSNAGVPLGPAARSFLVSDAASPYSPNAGIIEGWGYFPREEGKPTAALASAQADGIRWSEPLASGTASQSGRSALVLGSSPAASRLYSRSYGSAYDSAAGPAALPGTARSFVEACLKAVPGAPVAGASADVYDRSGAAWKLRDSGVGLELRNGPFRAILRLVEASSDGGASWHYRLGFPLRPADILSDFPVWALGIADLDWTKDQIVRLELKPNGTALECRALSKAAGATGPLLDSGIALGLCELPLNDELDPRAPAAFDAAKVSFGASSSPAYASMASTWEYVRYGFLDEAYSAWVGRDELCGLWKAQGSGDGASFRRSPDILIGDPASTGAGSANPALSGVSAARLRIGLDAALLGVELPFKLRLLALDWDETLESDTIGFFPTGFPAYGPAASWTSLGLLADTISAASEVLPAAGFGWNFDLKKSDLKRRVLLLAALDTPLASEVALLPARALAGILQADPPSGRRSDCRYAARQFLPDLFVRDRQGDDGSSLSGGWLCPDVALGAFYGSAPITPDADHPLRAAPPNPQAVDAANNSYPSGFALGEPYVPGTKSPDELAYSPSGPLAITARGAASSISVTDSAWSDYGSQCYFNRLWVRLSNRGVVPAPAKVQVFFLGSQMRAAFDARTARDAPYQKILAGPYSATPSSLVYVQDRFQLYDSAGSAAPSLVRAVPAMSGIATPDASATVPPNFVLAEFLWHVMQGAVPASADEAHSCRAICVNLPKPANLPDPANPPALLSFVADGEVWSTGVDEAPPLPEPATSDIWGANAGTNNIAVRNSNIVQGLPPAVNLKMAIVDEEPANFQKIPNEFRQSFGKPQSQWGLGLDARRFPVGDVVLRLGAAIVAGAEVKGFEAIEGKGEGEIEAIEPRPGFGKPSFPAYKFFLLKGGSVGRILGLRPKDLAGGRGAPVSLYFQPRADAKAGIYELTLTQTGNGKVLGGYRTAIEILDTKAAAYVADKRTGIVYDARRDRPVLEAIPYERMAVFSGPDQALQEGFRLNPTDELQRCAGKLKGNLVNIAKGQAFPKPPERLPLYEGGIEGAVVGRVLDREGSGLGGIEVLLVDEKLGKELGRGRTDPEGRYLLRIKAEGKAIELVAPAKRRLELRVESKSWEGREKIDRAGPDLCFAARDLKVKRA
ncbi:MAG TPA: hypothetical protein P5133_03010 [Spirochaetia bacterium]|nr:hypothetical protein [Spirochaetia bacterium]